MLPQCPRRLEHSTAGPPAQRTDSAPLRAALNVLGLEQENRKNEKKRLGTKSFLVSWNAAADSRVEEDPYEARPAEHEVPRLPPGPALSEEQRC